MRYDTSKARHSAWHIHGTQKSRRCLRSVPAWPQSSTEGNTSECGEQMGPASLLPFHSHSTDMAEGGRPSFQLFQQKFMREGLYKAPPTVGTGLVPGVAQDMVSKGHREVLGNKGAGSQRGLLPQEAKEPKERAHGTCGMEMLRTGMWQPEPTLLVIGLVPAAKESMSRAERDSLHYWRASHLRATQASAQVGIQVTFTTLSPRPA